MDPMEVEALRRRRERMEARLAWVQQLERMAIWLLDQAIQRLRKRQQGNGQQEPGPESPAQPR